MENVTQQQTFPWHLRTSKVAEYEIPLHTFGYQIIDNARNMIKAVEIFSLHGQANIPVGASTASDGEQASVTDDSKDDSDDDGFFRNCLRISRTEKIVAMW